MPKRLRLTRRPNIAMSEDAYRRLRSLSDEAGLNEGEFLSFLFEHWSSCINDEKFTARLRLFNSELDERKR
ncbi:hypothetical protein roselon_03622 [Roseibacterium elongatum DSM 19469]|uniref:Ribbon-helix-helix protein CopG domain-containing protein n=1 Tax=Roseicyclus elongatus DSM 19469 TaxID=1294273 RepID=W8SA17_9RHOB|nr:hypothetical protein [Roseibacterium elongatum]AHM05866.1 hypothetical protein roselon_03622 [Roseibacterium elongatum DSM 19469]